MDSILDREQRKRLIVLVPDSLAGNLDLANKIYTIALRDHRDVLYLTLVDDDEKMLAVSRSMATMKAVTSGHWLVVQSKLTETSHWLKTLREIYRPGDIIVCHEEQFVKDGFLRTLPLSEYLRATLKTPVSTISGFYHPQQVQTRRWLLNILFWLGCLAIVAGFTMLEIRLEQTIQGVARSSLLIGTLIIEFMTLWAWNNVTIRL